MSEPLLNFGPHRGARLQDVPSAYLVQVLYTISPNGMQCASAGVDWPARAHAELNRRGWQESVVGISDDAMDQASLRVLDCWQAQHTDGQGLLSWLLERGSEAWRHGQALPSIAGLIRRRAGLLIFDFTMEDTGPVIQGVTRA